jgi:hypothetical protein
LNPLGILQALVTALEAAADAVNPKRRKETKRERRRFLFWYFLFFLVCAVTVAWTIHSLYFSK